MDNQANTNSQPDSTQFLIPVIPKKKHISDSRWKRFRKIARAYIKSGFTDKELEQLLNEFNLNLSKRDSERLLANYKKDNNTLYKQHTYPLIKHRHEKTKGPGHYSKIKLSLETLEKIKNPIEIITEEVINLT